MRNRLICLLTAVAMLISGMCFELPQADSYFACPDSCTNASAMLLLAQPSPGNLPDSCTLRMLGHSNIFSAPASLRRRYEEFSGRTLLLHIAADTFFCGPTLLNGAGMLFLAAATTSHHRIIRFIHLGDGQK